MTQVQAFNRAANRPDFMRVDLMREWLVDLGDVGDDEEEKHLKVREPKTMADVLF